MNNKELSEKWISLLIPLFPQGAKVRFIPEKNDLTLHIDWFLGTDKARITKPSKLIELVISSEAVDNYKMKSSVQQAHDDDLLVSHVKRKYEQHNPEHDKSENQVPPTVKWTVTTKELNS